MFYQLTKQTLFCICLALLLVTMPAYAVKNFKVSGFGGGHQIWFEAEDYDERNPDTDEHYVVADHDEAFGKKAINRTGVGGGMMRWEFDISSAGGTGGTWYFWYRGINPSNQSDYLLVKGDPDDAEIPTGPPFPATNEVPPFVNADDRVFEENVGPPFGWARAGHEEGHTKELQNGKNTMYIFHRQGDNTVFWDVFVWADKADYVPTDADYQSAQLGTPVEPAGKLANVWGQIKLAR